MKGKGIGHEERVVTMTDCLCVYMSRSAYNSNCYDSSETKRVNTAITPIASKQNLNGTCFNTE